METLIANDHLKGTDTDSTFDLLAVGTSDSWTVFIDETPSGSPLERFLQIKSPGFYVSCAIPSLAIVGELCRYIRPFGGRDHSEMPGVSIPPLEIGVLNSLPFSIQWDTQDSDRCFLTVGSSLQAVRITIAGDDLRKFCEAILDLDTELTTDGLH